MLTIDPATGYAVPRVDLELDALVACGANDPDYGPAEVWPAWTDADCWELGPDPVHQAIEEIRHTAAFLGDDVHPIKASDLEAAANTLEGALFESEFPGVFSPELARTLAYGNCH